MVVKLLYGSGLRIIECLRLRVQQGGEGVISPLEDL